MPEGATQMQKTVALAVDADAAKDAVEHAKSIYDILATWAGQIAAVMGSLWAAYKATRYGWRRSRPIITRFIIGYVEGEMLKRWTDALDVQNAKLDDIKAQVERNGNRWRTLIDLHSVAMFECDVLGKCTLANVTACELFDLPEEQMHDYGWIGAMGQTPSERQQIAEIWKQAVAGGVPYKATLSVKTEKGFVDCTLQAQKRTDSLGNVTYNVTVERVGQ